LNFVPATLDATRRGMSTTGNVDAVTSGSASTTTKIGRIGPHERRQALLLWSIIAVDCG
jgi:hypothetical protein